MYAAEKMLVAPDGTPLSRVASIETEYAAGYLDKSRNDSPGIVKDLLDVAFDRYSPHHREFGRMYLDGPHPELSLPEDTVFRNIGKRLVHGHNIVAQQLEQTAIEMGLDPQSAYLIANNTTKHYTASWGSHENLLARRKLEPEEYISALAAYRLSRIVWSGSGAPGFDERGHYKFTLSERAPHIKALANDNSTHDRPLVNLRDTSYTNGRYRRIHDVSGETVFSPLVNAMRLAIGSVVLRACELGVNFDDLLPDDPVEAMHIIANDAELEAAIYLPDYNGGMHVTGIQHQRLVISRALKAAQRAEYITAEESYYSNRLLTLLDKLESDPMQCGREVDWVVKQAFVDKGIAASHNASDGSKHSDTQIAWTRAIGFHRIYPTPGPGMQLIVKGAFEDSPTEDELKNGLPLPEATRALVRGVAIKRARELHRSYEASWSYFGWKSLLERRNRGVFLLDPYNTDLSQLDRVFALAA